MMRRGGVVLMLMLMLRVVGVHVGVAVAVEVISQIRVPQHRRGGRRVGRPVRVWVIRVEPIE